MVGAVIARGEEILAEGYHRKVGAPHAEIEALKRLSWRREGATLYLNLEPCNHYGRTPPCTDAILQSGIRKVVVGMLDPNPQVRGRGVRRLRRAGIEVKVGVLQKECRRLNEAYVRFMGAAVPFVTLKVAASLDGQIAAVDGSSRWITGREAREFVHRLRSEVDAVLIGIGTVLKDDPRLTVVSRWRASQPVRIVLDTHLRTPLTSRLVRGAKQHPLWIVCGKGASERREKRLEERGVTVIRSTLQRGRISWKRLLRELAKREITHLLIEGGGRVNSSAIGAGVVDKLVYFVAPKLIGADRTTAVFSEWGTPEIDRAIRLKSISTRRIGSDLLFEGYLR